MSLTLDFAASPRLVFAAGALARSGELLLDQTGETLQVLLVADPGVPALAATLETALKASGHGVTLFTGLTSDPTAEQVDAAAEAARSSGAQAVVGLGGGSALDVAKLAAAIAPASVGVEHYGMMANPFPSQPLLCCCIPTTSGTGAEATRTAIFTRRDLAKIWTWGPELMPAIALLDPEVTVALPRQLTAATGVDALVHAIEAATNRNRNLYSDAYALQAIRLVRRHLPRALAMPDDLEARGGMQLAAYLAGQAIDGAGTAVAHALGHALGALAHVHHGRAVGLALRVALAGNVAADPARHSAVAEAFGLGGDVAGLPAAYKAFLQEVGFDPSLASEGLSLEDADRIAEETLKAENRPMIASTARDLSDPQIYELSRALFAL